MAVPGKRQSEKFSSTLSRGSGEDFELYCMPCDRDDIRASVFGYCINCEEHLCESCFNTHKRPKPLRHHKLLDKDNMPKTQQISSISSISTAAESSFTKPCPKHNQEKIKFYCHDHKSLLCSVCVTLDHPSSSCAVKYIPDISEQIVDSKEYTRILKYSEIVGEQCKKRTDGLKVMTNKSNKSLADVVETVRKFRNEINERIDELEKIAEDKVSIIRQENNERMKTAETKCADVMDLLQSSSARIRHLNTSKQADKLFVELKLAEQIIQDEDIYNQKVTSYDAMEYTLKPNEDISILFNKQKSFGSVMPKIDDMAPKPSLKAWHTLSQRMVCAKTSKDGKKCWITGMTLLSPKRLLIADYQHDSIKMIDTESKVVTDQFNLESSPWDITSVTKDKIAVTLPDQRLIIDLQGTVLNSVQTYSSGESIFLEPEYVTSNNSFIYISDKGLQAVIMLNWQGEVTGSFGGLGSPKGLATLEDGSVFVSDAHLNKCNIQHISGDCSRGKAVMQGIASPIALCWCSAKSALYFSSGSWDEENDNFIQIVELS